jgi:hypothetical protein
MFFEALDQACQTGGPHAAPLLFFGGPLIKFLRIKLILWPAHRFEFDMPALDQLKGLLQFSKVITIIGCFFTNLVTSSLGLK